MKDADGDSGDSTKSLSLLDCKLCSLKHMTVVRSRETILVFLLFSSLLLLLFPFLPQCIQGTAGEYSAISKSSGDSEV